MAVPKLYCNNSLPIAANRDPNGIYFIKTATGFTLLRVADTPGREWVPMDAPNLTLTINANPNLGLNLTAGANTVNLQVPRYSQGVPNNDWSQIARNTYGYAYDGGVNGPVFGQPFGATAGVFLNFGLHSEYPSCTLAMAANPYSTAGDFLFFKKNHDNSGSASQWYQVASRQWVAAQTYTSLNGNGYVKMTGAAPSYSSTIPYTDISGAPVVGNGTLTMNVTGVGSGSATFTANQSNNTSFTVTLPSFGTSSGSIAEGNHTHNLQQIRDTGRNISEGTGTAANPWFRLYGISNSALLFYPNAANVQVAQTFDTAGGYGGTLALQPTGGTLTYSGQEVATKTWTLSQIGNGTLTMNVTGIGSGSATFSANQSGNNTFTVTLPSFGTAAGTVAQGNHTHTLQQIASTGNTYTGSVTLGGATISGLTGTNTRMVVADASGALGTQDIPTFSDADQWEADANDYLGASSLEFGQGSGINTNGGYRTGTQVLSGSAVVKDNAEYILRIDPAGGASWDLEMPDPAEWPGRVLKIRNAVISPESRLNITGFPIILYASADTASMVTIDRLDGQNIAAPIPIWCTYVEVQSIECEVNNTVGYHWIVFGINMQ